MFDTQSTHTHTVCVFHIFIASHWSLLICVYCTLRMHRNQRRNSFCGAVRTMFHLTRSYLYVTFDAIYRERELRDYIERGERRKLACPIDQYPSFRFYINFCFVDSSKVSLSHTVQWGTADAAVDDDSIQQSFSLSCLHSPSIHKEIIRLSFHSSPCIYLPISFSLCARYMCTYCGR